MQIFIQKQKNLGIFGLQFNKNYNKIFNQHSQICETINFHLKSKKINLGPKKLYLGFWVEMLENYCHICNECPPICLIEKVSCKN